MRFLLGFGAAVALMAAHPVAALDICVEGAYPPFSQVLEDGAMVGFDIDMANALCARIGESCDLVRTNWDRMIPTLLDGGCDAIVASMSSTEPRKRLIDFTAPYYRSPGRFVARDGAGLADTPDGLAGKTIGVQLGTVNQFFVQAHYPEAALRVYVTQEHVLMDLEAGRLDAVFGEAAQLEAGFLETSAGEGFAFFGGEHFDPAIQGAGAAIGVRKDEPALRDALSSAIASIRADGSYQEIAAKYFDFDIYGGSGS